MTECLFSIVHKTLCGEAMHNHYNAKHIRFERRALALPQSVILDYVWYHKEEP